MSVCLSTQIQALGFPSEELVRFATWAGILLAILPPCPETVASSFKPYDYLDRPIVDLTH